MLSINRRNY